MSKSYFLTTSIKDNLDTGSANKLRVTLMLFLLLWGKSYLHDEILFKQASMRNLLYDAGLYLAI